MSNELANLNHTSQSDSVKVFTLFRQWLHKQFVLLGHKRDADKLAMHVLAFSQGAATVANAIHDDKFVKREVNQMCQWLESLELESLDVKSRDNDPSLSLAMV